MDDKNLIAFGSEVKVLGEGKIGGFLIRFTDHKTKDLDGDYFDSDTKLHFPETLPTIYQHGLDETIGKTVIGETKAVIQDAGLWAETQLNMRSEYEKAIYEMAKAGKLGYSSGALSHLVEREQVGKAHHIKTWFVGEASLTPTPADPMNQVVSIKSLLPSDAALPDNDDENAKENKSMDEKEKEAAPEVDVAKAVADAMKAYDDKKAAEAEAKAKKEETEQAIADAAYQKALDDVKAHKVSYHSTEPVDDDNEGVGAFKSWMRFGDVNEGLIVPDESVWKTKHEGKAAWNVTTGGTGGFLVPDPLYNQIIAKRNIASWVRQQPVQSFITSADHLLVPRESDSLTDFVLTAEAAAYDEEEGTVTQKDLIQYKYTKLTKISEEFLMYNATNFDSWLSETLGRAAAGTENAIFTTGDGSGNPEGVVTGATVANTTATTDIILPAELTALFGYLNGGYNVQSECGILMANTTKWYLAGDTGDAWQYHMGPQSDGVAMDRLLGYKVTVDDDVVTYTTASAKCVIFGNMNFYAIVEKPGMVVQRNPYLYMANGQVGIFASMFRGGGVLQSEAFYYLTNKAS